MFGRHTTESKFERLHDGGLFVAGLSAEDAEALLAASVRVTLRSGDEPSHEAMGPTLWLPVTAIVAFGERLGGRFVECGFVGREGVLGWEPLTGLAATTRPIGVIVDGEALAVPGERAAALCDTRPRLAARLLRYRETLIAQMRSTIAARIHCKPEVRLARWLCMLHDRVEGDTLSVTHSRLAAFINARRAGVTDALHLLEGERIVRCTRGKIVVRDRRALVTLAGESYGVAEAVHRTLIGPFGKGG